MISSSNLSMCGMGVLFGLPYEPNLTRTETKLLTERFIPIFNADKELAQ